MIIQRTTNFKKQYKKLPVQIQQQFDERIKLFVSDRTDPRLRVHPLMGHFKGYWSMNVNGDIRALFRQEGESIIIFGFIGIHSQLYG